jgi:hypothetical protein
MATINLPPYCTNADQGRKVYPPSSLVIQQIYNLLAGHKKPVEIRFEDYVPNPLYAAFHTRQVHNIQWSRIVYNPTDSIIKTNDDRPIEAGCIGAYWHIHPAAYIRDPHHAYFATGRLITDYTLLRALRHHLGYPLDLSLERPSGSVPPPAPPPSAGLGDTGAGPVIDAADMMNMPLKKLLGM